MADGFAEECRRQSLESAGNRRLEGEIAEWIEDAQDAEDWNS